ncbi:MAG TPA: hypothetical protein VLH15_08805 [Dehalococcoidales bacterium]|nr:hypothetical protein [Dehalococcoidales bacterium]
MKFENNPPLRTAWIWIGVMAAGILAIFLPSLIGLDGFDGGFALSLLGLFVALIGLITSVIYFRMAAALERITRKENILAHWRFSPEEWKKYTEREHKVDVGGRKGLFIMVAVITVIVGIIFWIAVRDNPLIIFLICLGIIAITGLTAWLTGWANYRHNKKNLGEAIVALDGVVLNRRLHLWKGIGNRLESITYEGYRRQLPQISITYSSPGRHSRNVYTARVPVPPGQEELAKKITADIAAAHLKESPI